jgi:hypothetical protein
MCLLLPTCEPLDIVMQRVAAEVSYAADELSGIESDVADLVSGRALPQANERLQTLDRLVQQLRALDVFLRSAGPCDCGRIDIENALDRVWLETMRKRLGGASPVAREAGAAEPDLW